MGDHIHEGDFFEADEPIEEIMAAWEQSTLGGSTALPIWFHLVTESTNTGLVSHVPLMTRWLTAEPDTANRSSTSAIHAPL